MTLARRGLRAEPSRVTVIDRIYRMLDDGPTTPDALARALGTDASLEVVQELLDAMTLRPPSSRVVCTYRAHDPRYSTWWAFYCVNGPASTP